MNSANRPRALLALMERVIDYAGLFPPAGLGMPEALRLYARYRSSPDAWALGRFVVPTARLDEFERELDGIGEQPGAWSLSALASLPLEAALARVARFNQRRAEPAAGWNGRIDTLEVKVTTADEIARASAAAPADLDVFFEVPADAGVDDLCGAAAAGGRGLKIRTGGVAVNAFPPSSAVARFLAASAAAGVPFKATAGLHHPIRSAHPVTYEPGAPGATMHGFLNVFVAAVLLFNHRIDVAGATRVLEDELPASFRFDDDGVGWREQRLNLGEVVAARTFARSFGSCSFEEPLSEVSGIVARQTPFR